MQREKNEKVASDPRDIISFLRKAKAEKTPEIPAPSKQIEKTPENPSTTKMETKDSESEDNISLKSNKILFEKDKKFQ